MFQPNVDQIIEIDGASYRFSEHPNAPGMVYGQEGRQAIVYKLVTEEGEAQALKVFKPVFRNPSLVSLADQISPYAQLPGLEVCQRTVLTPSRHAQALRESPDIIYAVLMKWIEGPTWLEVMLEKEKFTPENALLIAKNLSTVMVRMEERGLAHSDLSAANLILSPSLSQAETSLVDVEGIFAPGLIKPDPLPAGSPGYAHKTAPQGVWSSQADRFSGAVLMAEILGFCAAEVRARAWGESYFNPRHMQQENEETDLMISALQNTWGDTIANLFQRAWRSSTLAECPTFGEWMVA